MFRVSLDFQDFNNVNNSINSILPRFLLGKFSVMVLDVDVVTDEIDWLDAMIFFIKNDYKGSENDKQNMKREDLL